jgi:hypothetical protein
MVSATDLVDLLVRTGHLAPPQAARVAAWAAAQPGGDLAAALVRAAVFQPAAARTLDLMRKGFITATDPAVLFTPGGLDRLRAGDLPGWNPAPSPSGPAAGPDDPPPRPSGAVPGPPPRPRPSAVVPPRPSVIIPPPPVRPRPSGVVVVPPATYGPPPDPLRTYRANLPTRPASHPAAPPAPDPTPGVGSVLGKCLLTGVLGRGGRGTVFSALHTTLNIPVAVKVLRADGGEGGELAEELRHEAQLLAQLSHPNIVRVLDFETAGVPFVVMEMVEGPSLADLIGQTGGLRVERAAAILLEAAAGLAAAWELNIVHRDIKPGNILLTRAGGVKVADLGLAFTSGAAKGDSLSGSPVGTGAYMAPEQARAAGAVDFRADVYALGATFYHAATGQLPFTGRNNREMLLLHATAPLVPPHEAAPGLVDPDASAVVARMMAKDPAERHGSYAELMGDLRGLAGRAPAPARVETNTPPVQSAARKTTLMGWLFRKPGG